MFGFVKYPKFVIMKRTSIFNIFSLALGIGFMPVAANAQEVILDSKVSSVTVFLSGAQVTREGQAKLSTGNNEVIISGLTQDIDPNSIQVEGNPDYVIISVNFRKNFLEKTELPKEMRVIQDSILAIDGRMRRLDDRMKLFDMEYDMITSNQQIKGNNGGFDLDALVELADLYRNRLKLIKLGSLNIQRQKEDLQKHQKQYQQQLKAWRAKNNRPTGEIVVKVSTAAAKTSKFKVSYLAYKSGWTPAYDLRATDVKGPVALVYRGNVWQQTGEDWENVKFILSTGNPTLSGTQPQLIPWILTFFMERPSGRTGNAKAEAGAPAPASQSNAYFQTADAEEFVLGSTTAATTAVSNEGVNSSFSIQLPYSVASGDEPVSLDIQNISLPANYKHIALPKLDSDAFLTAQVTNWRGNGLLSGNASIYFQGTYVGQTYINTRITSDTLNLSLGRDKGINIKRKRASDYKANKIIGGNRVQEIVYEIQIRNNQKYAANMELADQIPMSGDKSVEVKLEDAGGAQYNDKTGKLTWNMVVGPGEQKTVRFKFTIKYPKDKVIPNL